MKELIKGLRRFKSEYFCRHQDLFENLAHGQHPRVLFITCSDSRVDPELLTQTAPGEIFVIRNAGNIVPPYGSTNGGEGATIEYAVKALDINQIVVCGHSHCGAMKGLLKREEIREELPLVYDWLKHAEATRQLIKEHYGDRKGEDLLNAAIAENVLTQIENLRTYPAIHTRLFRGEMKIYAWIYDMDIGEVMAYDPERHAYVPPQTMLPPEEQDPDLDTASPACTIPLSGTAPAPTTISNNGTPAAPVAATYSREVVPSHQRFPFVYMSPEQADRIYRGSSS
jgi:carbonic anhydrase